LLLTTIRFSDRTRYLCGFAILMSFESIVNRGFQYIGPPNSIDMTEGGENNRRKQNTNGRRSPWRNMCLPFCLSCNGGVNLYSCEEVEMFRAKKLIVLVLCVCAFNVLGSFAQTTTGRIVGSVADESGAVIPGVDITVRNPATGLVRNVVT